MQSDQTPTTAPAASPDLSAPVPASVSMVAPTTDSSNPSLASVVAENAAREKNLDKTSWRDTWEFFKRMAAYLKPYKRRFVIGEIAGIAFAFCSAALPLLTKTVLDYATAKPGVHVDTIPLKSPFAGGLSGLFHHLATGPGGIVIVCAAIPALMLLRGICEYVSNYFVVWTSLKVLSDMRRQVFSHINSQSLQFFLQNRSGNLISRVANDTRVTQQALGFIGTDLIKQPVCVVLGIYTLFHLDARFTMMSLVLFPLCILPVSIYGRRIRKSGRKEEEQAGQMTAILQETFAGIRVIKSFAREDYQVAQFEETNQAQFLNGIRVRRAMEIVSPMVEVVAAMGVGLALFYLYYMDMGLSKFFSLAMGLFFLYAPVKQMSRMHMQIQKCQAAMDNIFALLALKPTVQDQPKAKELTTCTGAVEFQRLYFQYEGAPSMALNNFNLRIHPGQTIALVGESGAGKSTVLSLLQRFYDPQGGEVLIDGEDVRGFTQRSLREQIGVVTQDTFLFHDTIYENIRYGRLEGTAAEIEEAAKQAYIHDFILTLPEGYQTKIGDKGCRLSGGQQQRLAIARALLKNAPILLLDEATSALDSESERMIQTALEKLSAGKTVIAIAHRLSTILKADTILVMDGGQIVEKGKHAHLYAKGGRYRRLYDLQFDHEIHAREMAAATLEESSSPTSEEEILRPMSLPMVS